MGQERHKAVTQTPSTPMRAMERRRRQVLSGGLGNHLVPPLVTHQMMHRPDMKTELLLRLAIGASSDLRVLFLVMIIYNRRTIFIFIHGLINMHFVNAVLCLS